MKKLLLIAAATAALSTSALAEEGMMDSLKSGFYLRSDVGSYWNTTQKLDHGVKFKGKAAPSLDVGIGYHVNEQLRGELVYTHLFDPELKSSDSGTYKDGKKWSASGKLKGKVDALLVNFLFDAYDFGAGKLFCGAGLGWAQVSEKGTFTATINDKFESGSDKLKKKNNFAYNLMVGSSFKIADGVNLDLKYKWADYGTAKYDKNDDEIDDNKKIHRRGNAVNLGIRFDL